MRYKPNALAANWLIALWRRSGRRIWTTSS